MSNKVNRKIQLLELDLLKIIIDICEKHNLTYYVIGGSLIGILRHKGFIPWDDDIDVGLPRKDYDKFIEIFKQEFAEEYGILSHDSDPSWCFNFVQVIDKKITIDVYMTETPRRCNLWVDLFPIDGLPSNKLKRKIHSTRILLMRYLIQIANIETQVDTHKVGRPFYERAALKMFKFLRLGKLINVDKKLLKMDKALRKYDFYDSEYVGNLLGKYREREIVPQSYFGKPGQLQFEDIMVNVPAKYHELQTNLYGDYMKLPPEDQRVSHDIVLVMERDQEIKNKNKI